MPAWLVWPCREEGWPSGRRRMPGERVDGDESSRGFESRPLRHITVSRSLSPSRQPSERRALWVFCVSSCIQRYRTISIRWGNEVGNDIGFPIPRCGDGDRTMARTGKLLAVEVAKAKGP